MPSLEAEFKIVDFKGYGGSLLHFLLGGIAGNFAGPDPEAQSLLSMLFQIEDSLIRTGQLKHDFACVIARIA